MIVLALMPSMVSANAQVSQPKKYVTFRDDDVEPFVSLETLQAVNQVHIAENVPVTLGIIPNPLASRYSNELLQDGQFLSYMRSIDGSPLFEFAQHGYTHRDIAPSPKGGSEFYGRPYAAQYEAIKQGRDDIIQAFGVTPTTFIPPWGLGDNNTLAACAALGFTMYSPSWGPSNVQAAKKDGVRIIGGMTIGASNTNSTEMSDVTFNATIQAAENETLQFLANPNATMLSFVYHAWAFKNAQGGVDSYKIQQLINFINFLKSEGVLFTRLDRSTVTGDSNPVIVSLGAWLAESAPLAAVSPLQGAGVPVLQIAEEPLPSYRLDWPGGVRDRRPRSRTTQAREQVEASVKCSFPH